MQPRGVAATAVGQPGDGVDLCLVVVGVEEVPDVYEQGVDVALLVLVEPGDGMIIAAGRRQANSDVANDGSGGGLSSAVSPSVDSPVGWWLSAPGVVRRADLTAVA